jgi:hypothetical protein
MLLVFYFLNQYFVCISYVTVKTKFSIAEDPRFVMEDDGCEIDADDIVVGAAVNSVVIFLCNGENWDKACDKSAAEAPPIVVAQQSSPGRTMEVGQLPLGHSPVTNNSRPGSECFLTNEAFRAFLLAHPKSRRFAAELAEGKYSTAARRAVTQVTTAKVVEAYSNYPSKNEKVLVSQLLARVTGLSMLDFFDPQTHRGYLAKDLDNLRRKLPDCEKRWVWKQESRGSSFKKKGIDTTKATTSELPALPNLQQHDSSQLGDLESSSGCCRSIADCEFCNSESSK